MFPLYFLAGHKAKTKLDVLKILWARITTLCEAASAVRLTIFTFFISFEAGGRDSAARRSEKTPCLPSRIFLRS